MMELKKSLPLSARADSECTPFGTREARVLKTRPGTSHSESDILYIYKSINLRAPDLTGPKESDT